MTARRRPGPALRAGTLCALLLLGLLPASRAAAQPSGGATKPAPRPAAGTGARAPSPPRPASGAGASAPASRLRAPVAPARPPLEDAREALAFEEIGDYIRAAATLKELRPRVPADADLELALAIDEARSGWLDSASVRLWSPLLSAAMRDSMPLSRRRRYPWHHEALLVNGGFDGWNWYVARARAEVAAARGRWAEARDAARACVAARPLSGKDWHILAVSAGRAGDLREAAHASAQAALLDPALPEARHLYGIYAWMTGHRAVALESFRAAVALDSSYRAPALALVRSQLPSAMPDTLPTELLTGVRRVALLCSSDRPKLEEPVRMDTPVNPTRPVEPAIPDSLHGKFPAMDVALPIFVDERGRIVLSELPWFPPSQLPVDLVRQILATLPEWRFDPARKLGAPRRVWTSVQFGLKP